MLSFPTAFLKACWQQGPISCTSGQKAPTFLPVSVATSLPQREALPAPAPLGIVNLHHESTPTVSLPLCPHQPSCLPLSLRGGPCTASRKSGPTRDKRPGTTLPQLNPDSVADIHPYSLAASLCIRPSPHALPNMPTQCAKSRPKKLPSSVTTAQAWHMKRQACETPCLETRPR